MPQRKQKLTPTTADSDYTLFLKSVEPIIISLVESSFRVDREQYFNEESKRLSIAWQCVPSKVKHNCFDAHATLVVKLGSPKPKSKPSVEITAVFEMHFHGAKPINRAFVDRFADSEVRLVIWPYFREYVSSVSGRMHVPPIVLPFGTRG